MNQQTIMFALFIALGVMLVAGLMMPIVQEAEAGKKFGSCGKHGDLNGAEPGCKNYPNPNFF